MQLSDDSIEWKQALELLESVSLNGELTYSATSDKAYRVLMLHRNVTSYSQLTSLHACPRKFFLTKHSKGVDHANPFQQNLDFAFGHAVGAGVQSFVMTKSKQAAYLNAFFAWSAHPFETDPRRGKALWLAFIAIDSFISWSETALIEWELAEVNGRPAVEVSFKLDTENGYSHYGHIDLIMRHRRTQQLCVFELKTTSLYGAEEAVYANSDQSLSYSLVVQAIAPEQTSYQTNYMVWSTKDRLWHVLPFEKSISDRVEWIRSLLLDHETLDRYHQLNFYPKRGEACFNYARRCQFFGECDLTATLPQLPDANTDLETVDFKFSLSQLIGVLDEAQ